MQQRVRKLHRGKRPSSSGQLPVPVALNAGSPTLFANNIHQRKGFVNTPSKKITAEALRTVSIEAFNWRYRLTLNCQLSVVNCKLIFKAPLILLLPFKISSVPIPFRWFSQCPGSYNGCKDQLREDGKCNARK